MKKFILPALLLAGFAMNAQTTIYSGDGALTSNRAVSLGTYSLRFTPSVGTGLFINGTNGWIGVNTVTPTEALEVNGNIKGTSGIFIKSAANGQTFSTAADRAKASSVILGGTLLNSTTGARTFQFFDFPQSNMNSTATVWFSILDRGYMDRLRFSAGQSAGAEFVLYDKSQAENFKLADDGNNNIALTMPKANSKIGIGTTSFTDGTDTYMLAVNGNIRAKRVKVYTTWADYVFEDSYKLPTLEEVEKHIKEKGHLQDIPSAKEVEEKGIELGEMNKLLLQKIEELTLYMIDQKKENEKQAQHIQKLEEQVKALTDKK